jgi:transposase InsO family protein
VNDDNTQDSQSVDQVQDFSDAFQHLYHVSEKHEMSTENCNFPPEYCETLSVNGVPIRFTIDTACPVAIIPHTLYQKHFCDVPLQPAKLQLSSYSKHEVPVLGFIQVQVEYGNRHYDLPLYVTQGEEASLLGRQWLQYVQLQWNRVFALATSSMTDLLNQYSDVFCASQGTIQHFKADIKVKDNAEPLFHRPRPVPFALKGKVSAELDKLESQGVITKINRSDWAAPIVVVPKADNSIRICGDYKVTVNKAVQGEVYPLPTAEDIFATLSGGEVFTKLDLSSAYQQLELSEASQQYLVINTHQGLYRFNRLSFGVSVAPNIFQKVMDQVLQGLQGVTCYLDDILISSKRQDHVDKVKAVLDRLRKFGIRAKRNKCSFMMNSVTYLGHLVCAEGIRPTNDKIKAIQALSQPKDIQQLRSLLGVVNYYAKFLPNLSSVLAPLYNLLRKDAPFTWNQDCVKALAEVKRLLSSDKLLVHYDPHKPITLACDASPVGLGCVLSHVVDGVEQPIAYASRSLTKAESHYCQLEREGLAIIFGLAKFHKYVYGRKFTIITDNKPVARILGPKKAIPSLAAARLQRWAMILMSHNYEILCRSSQAHGNCDTLSRFPSEELPLATEQSVNYFSQVNSLPITAREIADLTRNDPVLAKAYDYTMSGWPSQCPNSDLQPYFSRRDQLSADQGCLLWGSRVVVPPSIRTQLLQELHEDHPGIVRMKSRARMYLWFPGIDGDIEAIVHGCSTCQAMQKDLPPPPLIPWSFPQGVWQRLHIDYAEYNKKFYLILIDAYSKWIDAIPMSTTTSSQTIKELRRLFAMFGLPETVVSDNGPQFVSAEFEQFLASNGVKHVTSAPYHPATNGAAERTVQTVKDALKKFEIDSRPNALQSFLFTYRNTPHATTGQCPAQLFLNRQPRTRFSLLKPQPLSVHVQAQQERQKLNHDKRAHEPQEFQEGEVVRIKNFPNSFPRYVKGQIVQKLGPYRYKVKIGTRVRVVHLEQIRSTGELDVESNDLPDPMFPDDSLTRTMPPTLFQQRSQPAGLPAATPVVRDDRIPPEPRQTTPVVRDARIPPEPRQTTPVVRDARIPPEPRRNPVRNRIPRRRLIEEM